MTFLIYARKRCPDAGTKHLQGYVEFKSQKGPASFQKHIYFKTCQIEMRSVTGVTNAEAASYCTGAEEGLFFQHGLMSKKSARGNSASFTTKDMILAVGHMTRAQAAAALGVSPQLLMHRCKMIWKEGDYTWTKISGFQYTKGIADYAQKDLDETLPALEAATKSLKSLNKSDIVEVKAMKNPPAGVKLTFECVCILQKVKPIRKDDSSQFWKPRKINVYWEPPTKLLNDPQSFLNSLFSFDKDGMEEAVPNQLTPYIEVSFFFFPCCPRHFSCLLQYRQNIN
jgi:hypothetical protein